MANLLDYASAQTEPRPSSIRWVIGAMLFLAAILNYIDRQTLSILAPTIQKDLKLSEDDYANIASLFLLAYTISLLLSGRFVDWLGSRLSLAVFITWWSIANMLTGLARSFGSLAACRFLLGLGEAGNWPASTKTVTEWFPARERGTAIGFYTMGATVGATVAPGIITLIIAYGHWQWAFVITGAIGLLWVVPWLFLSRMGAPLAQTAAELPPADAPPESETARWANVLGRSDVWILMIARMLTDPVWYFYQFWFAKYLSSARDVTQEGLAITWVIFLAADIGSLLGGLASGFLIRRGAPVVASRLRIMTICAALAPLSILIGGAPEVWMALALAMIVVFAHLSWLVNITALLVDVVPRRYVATAFGVVAAGSAVGGIVMNKVVANLVTHHTYSAWFVIAAFLHPIALLILLAWSRLRQQTIGPENPIAPL